MSHILFEIAIDKSSDTPIYIQLGDSILQLIEAGSLKKDEKLPAIRKLASIYGVNNETIVRTYKYLLDKKCVYSHVGKGTFVSPIPVALRMKPVISKNFPQELSLKFDIDSAINFAATSTFEDLFPVDDFKKMFNVVLERDKGMAFSYEEGLGYFPLRERISDYVSEYGIQTDASKIQIIAGAQQGIDIVSKVLLGFGDRLLVEKPTFYGAVGAFLSRGGQIFEIPIDKDGIDLEMFEDYSKLYSPKFFYMMSYFQTPSSISYSLAKKREILEICDKYDMYIVEEDNVSDFHYGSGKIVPLKALDYKNRVIYIKTFSKILMPGLRIGFLIYPKKFIAKIESDKSITDASSSSFIQRAFHLYLESGLWDRHKKSMISYYKKKYELTVSLCDKYLSRFAVFDRPNGGLSLWLKLLPDIDITVLCNELLKRNVIVSPGNLYYANGDAYDHIRISFSNVTDADIERGLATIELVLRDMCDGAV